jgi:hypothetical protein
MALILGMNSWFVSDFIFLGDVLAARDGGG